MERNTTTVLWNQGGFIKNSNSIGEEKMSEAEKRKLLFIINTYGTHSQQDKAIEEMSELQKAILKHRWNPSEETRKDIIDERVLERTEKYSFIGPEYNCM